MSGLNLTKYIGEVASALVEVKLKMSDIASMVELCSAIHQKYAEFTGNNTLFDCYLLSINYRYRLPCGELDQDVDIEERRESV